ncbi:hypothetical protein E6O75_ATG06846 [Venturia nashicola]|uniref:25S rRNA (uridine-N(3))-methyltransferase BMT5-like domain-containing protein n=1 Tax=Venturia nashicola TaxID=86259 RepID=A0A4Z1P5I3_9PEZI|nr:hypothetical protein E6O75_ATG06846 [Venturia nashicola]
MVRAKKNKCSLGTFSRSERGGVKVGRGREGEGKVGGGAGKGMGKSGKMGKGEVRGGKGEGKKVQASQQGIVPFDVFDGILCVGEGDLSFTTSLLLDHGCASITSTTFDSEPELLRKYPHVTSAIETIRETEQHLFHDIDATKLSSYKLLRTNGPYDRIFFMFPHVGGKSTSVNKQVRANQALLAGFFGAAKGLLRREGQGRGDGETVNGGEGASILVTVFEGEPYTLWNVRDLARSVGLVVKRSWRFQKEVYPRYRHARTLGVVLKKGMREGDGKRIVQGQKVGEGEGDQAEEQDEEADGEVEDEETEGTRESETAWRGENREARTYEFGIKPEEVERQDLSRATGGNDVPLAPRGGKKIDYLKRKWNEDSSTDED